MGDDLDYCPSFMPDQWKNIVTMSDIITFSDKITNNYLITNG